jgi:hypothetical protein
MPTATSAPEYTPAPLSPPEPITSRSRRARKLLTVVAVIVALLVVASAMAFAIKVKSERAVGWMGGATYVTGAGAIRHDDPFGAEPSDGWAEVTYTPGATFKLGFDITNMSHTQSITIRAITWEGLSGPGRNSPLSSATLNVAYGQHGSNLPIERFHPFRLGPKDQVYIEWTFTMCQTGIAQRGGSTDEFDYEIDYTYFGFHKNQELPLPLPLQIDGFQRGCMTGP